MRSWIKKPHDVKVMASGVPIAFAESEMRHICTELRGSASLDVRNRQIVDDIRCGSQELQAYHRAGCMKEVTGRAKAGG